MRYPERDAPSALLKAAKEVFLEEGFERASLRKICAKAGVTTGAVYFLYKNKEELFGAIVGKTVEEAEDLCNGLMLNELHDLQSGAENEQKLIDFLYVHREEIELLINRSKGTKYENSKKRALHWLEEAFLKFFNRYGQGKIDREFVHILAEMRLTGYLAIVNGGYTAEKMRSLSEKIGRYAEGGFEKSVQLDQRQ